VIERDTVEALYRAYGSAVERRARALLGNDAEASDAVQDVFIRVLQCYCEFRGESSPMTWLYRITTNLCLNRLRDRRRRSELHQELAGEQPPTGRRMEPPRRRGAGRGCAGRRRHAAPGEHDPR
jgi:RNA polymerase sigma factor (sigma-70 family)